MFIMDTSNFRVLRWTPGDTIGVVVAGGNGNGGGSNQISYSNALFVDSLLNVYVSESSNHRVTLWLSSNPSTGNLVLDHFIYHYQ